MENASFLSDGWRELMLRVRSCIDLEATARSHGAFARVREVKDPETLLRLAIAYGACGMSLRETCAWAAASGIAQLSDPALLKRHDLSSLVAFIRRPVMRSARATSDS